jgi:hypothetical protein
VCETNGSWLFFLHYAPFLLGLLVHMLLKAWKPAPPLSSQEPVGVRGVEATHSLNELNSRPLTARRPVPRP